MEYAPGIPEALEKSSAELLVFPSSAVAGGRKSIAPLPSAGTVDDLFPGCGFVFDILEAILDYCDNLESL